MSYKELDPFNYIDIKPKNYKSKQELYSDLEDISKNLDNITNEWKERETSLRQLGSISRGNRRKSDIFIKYFNTKLYNSLEIQLSDLRSSVMKEACKITSLCARELGLLIEPGITQLLTQSCLFKIAGSANKVISDSSSKCILNIVRYVHCIKIITNICEIRTMKANSVRILCAQCLVNIFSYYDDTFIIKTKEILEETIKCLLTDANAEVRLTTRKAFILYKSRFDKEGQVLFDELGKHVQKQIIEDEKNFDNNIIKNQKISNNEYIKSISNQIDDNLNNINYLDIIQNKPKTPEFNLLKKKASNDFNKNENNSNKNNIIYKKARNSKKSVNKNNKNYIGDKKEDTVKYINVDDDVADDDEDNNINLNNKEDKKEQALEPDNNINKIIINNEDSNEINAVFNYSSKLNKKLDNKNNIKKTFHKKSKNRKNETSNDKIKENKFFININSTKTLNDNIIKDKKFESQNLNNKTSQNTDIINTDINNFNIDDLINNKDKNNSNNIKKIKNIQMNNSSRIAKTISNITRDNVRNFDISQENSDNIEKIKNKNSSKNNESNNKDIIDNNFNKNQILKKLNAKFKQLESGGIKTTENNINKVNFIDDNKKRGKSGDKMDIINYENNKIKNIKINNTKKIKENNYLTTNALKNNKTIDSSLYKTTDIDISESDNYNKFKKVLPKPEIKDFKLNNEEEKEVDDYEQEEVIDAVIDIDLNKKKDKAKTYIPQNNFINSNNNITNNNINNKEIKDNKDSKQNTYHFSKSTRINKNPNNLITINNINTNNNNNKIKILNIDKNKNTVNNDNNDNNEKNILSNESIEQKINTIIDKLDNLINQNEKVILFQYLFNHFNLTLKEIKNLSPNSIKRYIDIHIENLKENYKTLVEQVIKNLMRMIFYMNQIFNSYEIESILKILLFSISEMNDKTINKLSIQLLEIIKKKCDNEELFKIVYSLMSEYNSNYDNCYDFMYLLIPECDNILNNNNYFKQVFRLLCLTDKNSKKVGKIIDILYRKYTNNFNQAYEEETNENKKQILMFMEKTNSLYFREFQSAHENPNIININFNNKYNDLFKNNNNISEIKKEKANNEIENLNKENIKNNNNNKNSNLPSNLSNKNNLIYNQNNKINNNISNTINTNVNGNNIISINNSHNNNIIITNKLPDDTIPNDIKVSIQNNSLDQYMLYIEEHKSYIPEFILLLSNKKYSDEKSTITLLNFTKAILNSKNFSIDLNPCINLMVKQLIYILTSHKDNELIMELIKNILTDMPIYLTPEKYLSSMAKYLTMDNESIVLEILLSSLQDFIINSKNKKINKNDNNNEIIPLEKLLDYFIFEVFNLLKHQNSEIRKRAVYCCVEINVAIGKKFEPFLVKLTKAQQNLIKLFIKKRNG